MNKIKINACLLSLTIFAANAADYTGSADFGYSHSTDSLSSKFNEYGDHRNGVFGNLNGTYDNDQTFYYHNFSAQSILSKDQSYNLNGGQYGLFKYDFNYNEIIHHLSLGAKTFYKNPGESILTYDTASATPTNPFDYYNQNKTLGIKLSSDLEKKFFSSLDAQRKITKGQRPTGASSVELPEVTDYVTTDVNGEFGYRGDNFLVAIHGSISKFENENDFQGFKPYTTSATLVLDKLGVPPDNKYTQIGIKGSWFNLPFNSVMTANVNKTYLTDSVTPWTVVKSSVTATKTISINNANFDGKHIYDVVNLSISSEPLNYLNTKVYYKYLNDSNESTQMTFVDVTGDETYSNNRFEYMKHTFGVGLDYSKLPFNTLFQSGAERESIVRSERGDSTRGSFPAGTGGDSGGNTDHTYFVQLKNKYFDIITPKVKYQYLTRDEDFRWGKIAEVTHINRYIRKFDTAPRHEKRWSIGTDLNLTENWDMSSEYRVKSSDFLYSTLGLARQNSTNIYIDTSYNFPDILTITAFIDHEKSSDKTNKRVDSNASSPYSTPTSSAYNWQTDVKNTTTTYGFDCSITLIKKELQLLVSASRQRNEGGQDITLQPATAPTPAITNIDHWADYRKDQFKSNLIYTFNKNYEANLAYSYEKLSFYDIATDNYKYNYVTGSTNYELTGAYSDVPYRVNTVAITGTYRF